MKSRLTLLSLSFALAMLMGACADTEFQPGVTHDASPFGGFDFALSLDGQQSCGEVIDLVFVLDVSSSMTRILDTLEREIDRVVTASNALAEDSRFGLVPFVDNHVIDATGPLEGGKVHIAAATLQAAFANYRDIYTAYNINPADGPTGPQMQNPICEENALDALYAAAEEFPWREGSTRVIIVATDDTFLERPDNYGDKDGDGDTTDLFYPREGDYPALRTLAETKTLLRANKIRVFSFSWPASAGLSTCGTGRRLPAAFAGAGWNMEYKGQSTLSDSTDGKDFDLTQIFGGQISLTETINNVVLESRCNPIK
ncbi:MAG: hypothetical protein JRH20_30595 [Deltaproteobacteria bacterium]|nr:hypothetical protein [Deltaproteobacteria bacterium]